MALAQADRVAAALRHTQPGLYIELASTTTTGDRWTGALTTIGGKGAFVRELDQAQLDGQFDLAVHCLKDIPGDEQLPEGLTIAAYLPREDVHDAVVSRHGAGLDELPVGAVVGTSSVRRRAQLARHWPHLSVAPVRGNANTRLSKLDAGEYDALILAVSGLQRIGAAERITAVLPVETMLPAVGAGVIAVTVRVDDQPTRDLVARLNDPTTTRVALAERAMLLALAGHCHSPIAGLATVEADGSLRLRGAVYTPDGATCLDAAAWATADDPEQLGRTVAQALTDKGARDLIDAVAH